MMENRIDRIEKPLRFSEILDLTFSIFKNHFGKMLLITLLFIGPVYLFQLLALFFEIPDAVQIVIPILLSFFSMPIATASLIIAVDRIRKNTPIELASIFRQAFQRYFALIGGTVVYTLVFIGLFIVIGLIAGIYFFSVTGMDVIESLMQGDPSMLAGLEGLEVHFIVIAVFFLISGFFLTYLSARLSFYFPAVVFEKVSPGLRKSWKLTKGNFWRLIGLLSVFTVLLLIVAMVLLGLPGLFLSPTVISILDRLVNLLFTIISGIAYAVIYFDLRVRNEGADLQEILASYNDGDQPEITE